MHNILRSAQPHTLFRLDERPVDEQRMRHHRVEDAVVPAAVGFERLVRDGKILRWGVSNFDTPDMHEAHDALLCIADGRYVVEDDRRRVTREHDFKSAEAMAQVFADLPEVHSRNTAKVKPIISNFLKENQQYLNILFTDANGTTRYDYDPLTGTPPPGFKDAPSCFPVDVRSDGVYVELEDEGDRVIKFDAGGSFASVLDEHEAFGVAVDQDAHAAPPVAAAAATALAAASS